VCVSYGVARVDAARPVVRRGRTPANKGKTYPVEILTSSEIRDRASQCSATTSLGLRHRALIVLMYRTGLRISESLALHPKDVNLGIGAVVVLHGKGNRQRTVGIDRGANRTSRRGSNAATHWDYPLIRR
jgi:site-specific recombinase XerD